MCKRYADRKLEPPDIYDIPYNQPHTTLEMPTGLADDKSLFRQWDAKLSNVLARLLFGYEWARDHMKECLGKGSDPEEELTLGAAWAAWGDFYVSENWRAMDELRETTSLGLFQRHPAPSPSAAAAQSPAAPAALWRAPRPASAAPP